MQVEIDLVDQDDTVVVYQFLPRRASETEVIQ